MDDLKNQLSELIENNKIDKAIVILKEESSKRGGQLDHIIISLSSRYKRYREKSLMGLEARDQEFTKIVSDTLELVKALDDPSKIVKTEEETSYSAPRKEVAYSPPSSSSSDSNKYVQMGIGGLAVIGVIALVIFFAGGGDEPGFDETAAYDDTYIEPMGTDQGVYDENTEDPAGGNQETYDVYDVSGHWRQVSQSFGPENDCADCTIDITQNGNSISLTSNDGMYAALDFINQYGLFEGALNWGDISPNDPEQAAQLYFDENGYLVLSTMIQGVEYQMFYAE